METLDIRHLCDQVSLARLRELMASVDVPTPEMVTEVVGLFEKGNSYTRLSLLKNLVYTPTGDLTPTSWVTAVYPKIGMMCVEAASGKMPGEDVDLLEKVLTRKVNPIWE